MDNASIARALRRVASLLDLDGADRFRVRAYRAAADAVEHEPEPLGEIVGRGGDLTGIPGIGAEMDRHLRELVATGELALAGELASRIPDWLVEVSSLPGVGATRALQLRRDLGIDSLAALEQAARLGRVRRLSGFGVATQARILDGLRQRRVDAAEVERRRNPKAAASEVAGRVELDQIRGDLQMHSTWSDGRDTIESMARACAERGYEYMAITDHSRALAVAGGLDGDDLRRQAEEIGRVRRKLPGVRILQGVEVEILADGALDLGADVLGELDIVVGAIHSRFELGAAAQTARVLRALDTGLVDVLAHPTGRRLGRRPPMKLDLEAILRRAAELDVAVELNALPQRMDLAADHLERARELGARVAINTDAHSTSDLAHMAGGVAQARRAGLRKRDVLNALTLGSLRRRLRRRREGL